MVSRGGILPRPLGQDVVYGAATVASVRRLRNLCGGAGCCLQGTGLIDCRGMWPMLAGCQWAMLPEPCPSRVVPIAPRRLGLVAEAWHCAGGSRGVAALLQLAGAHRMLGRAGACDAGAVPRAANMRLRRARLLAPAIGALSPSAAHHLASQQVDGKRVAKSLLCLRPRRPCLRVSMLPPLPVLTPPRRRGGAQPGGGRGGRQGRWARQAQRQQQQAGHAVGQRKGCLPAAAEAGAAVRAAVIVVVRAGRVA